MAAAGSTDSGRRVLCVCVGNISRSPMMQVLLAQRLGTAYVVESAGISRELAGHAADSRSVACMEERGLDLRRHVSRSIVDVDLATYQWIVCVGDDEAEQVRSALDAATATVLVANAEHGGIPDPYELGLEGYRDCVALLDRVLPDVAARIRNG